MAKRTKYQLLQKAKTRLCNATPQGKKKAKESFDKAAKNYEADAVKKGKKTSEAKAIVSKIRKKSCSVKKKKK